MSTLLLQNICYSYEKGRPGRPILNNLNAEFASGRFYAILGPSGSGKTTLLNLLGGLDAPQQGRILFAKEEIAQRGLAYHRRNRVALIFQNYNLLDYLTPLENVALTAREDAAAALHRLGLTAAEARRSVRQLSGGQQQRVAIARALACGAPLILADEPTGSLDADTAAEIGEVLRENAHQLHKCVLAVTHSAALAAQADVVLSLEGGRLKIKNVFL